MRKPKSSLAVWYDRLASFRVESLFAGAARPRVPRTVFVNQPLPGEYFDQKGRIGKAHVYSTNQVVTSKYTVLTFLPRNLLEQFRRIANVFFAVIAFLQFSSTFSTISPGLVILPLLVVLSITAIKDGYEDIKRHQSDRHINHSLVRVLTGGSWANPNVMGPKSRTFVKGVVPKKIRVNVRAVGNGIGNGVGNGVHDPATQYPPQGPVHDDSYDDEDSTNPARPHWVKTRWEDVRVGDFVKITNEESFPADILICATSEEENVCFVETKNLDGETNLKSRSAVPALTYLTSAAKCADPKTSFHIDCDRPDPNMYKMTGAVVVRDEKHPLDLQTVLLRGTVLKNTKWVIGVVLYTGADSKIVLNSGGTPSKRSKVERQMNPQVFINLLILAAMAVACGIVDSFLEHQDFPRGAPWLEGDNTPGNNPSINGLITFIFALITFQNIIPISLYISIEAVRTIQALFIYFDREIYYEKTDQATLSKSWNLSDDLGQIQYIFSDKTGTLTQNAMVFRQCSVGGKVYRGEQGDEVPAADPVERLSGSDSSPAPQTDTPDPLHAEGAGLSDGVLHHFRDANLKADLEDALSADADSEGATHARALNGFFNVLALCHTVLTTVDPETNKIEYKAQSPDEAALVQAAADVGFVFRGRDRETLRLQTPFSDHIEEYELLNVLDFTSARKRMSVILRKATGDDHRIFVFTKGADNVIFERLKLGVNEDLKKTTEEHLDAFASEGLRTLTLAYKVCPNDFYEQWSERYHEAIVSLEDREGKIEKISDEIEHDLRLLGATAIEDKLQDGVPETIADLKRGGIKVWVATGDKLETAIAIGYSTNLIAADSNLIVVRSGDPDKGDLSVFHQMCRAAEEFFPEFNIIEEEELLEKKLEFENAKNSSTNNLKRTQTGISSIVGKNNGDRPGGFVLVIEGIALGLALRDDENKRLLLRLAIQCEAVICCRVSPLQKAQIVRLVKEGIGAMTLAIGDGANDVSMIQAADVGVGISGEEGLQAVNSSDYAIAQFRFLKRLLFVHGHWSYARNANMIVNFFYKNVVCIGILWWFQIYCGFSSQYVFEYTYLLFWNVFWSLCPVIAIGIFDRIIDDDILMSVPELYRYGRQGYWFGTWTFVIYMFDAIYQSAVIFFIINYAYFSPTARSDGYDVALYEFSTTMVITAVMAVNAFNGLNTSAWTNWVVFSVTIGVVLVWLYTAIYSLIAPGWFYVPIYGDDHYLFRSAICWLSMPVALAVALAPRFIAKAWRFNFAPNDVDVLRWIRKVDPKQDITQLGAALGNYPISQLISNADTVSMDDTRRPGGARSRPSIDLRGGSRTDMSTGLRSVHRGFDFATEENGVAMRRMQSNLSERRLAVVMEGGTVNTKRHSPSNLFSLRRSIRKQKPPS